MMAERRERRDRPEFGNPYNDMASTDAARSPDDVIPWLERAKLAKRYEPQSRT
jgi:hypothetical protein